jgi:hypothetical protein
MIVYKLQELPAEMVSSALANKNARAAELRAAFDTAKAGQLPIIVDNGKK